MTQLSDNKIKHMQKDLKAIYLERKTVTSSLVLSYEYNIFQISCSIKDVLNSTSALYTLI